MPDLDLEQKIRCEYKKLLNDTQIPFAIAQLNAQVYLVLATDKYFKNFPDDRWQTDYQRSAIDLAHYQVPVDYEQQPAGQYSLALLSWYAAHHNKHNTVKHITKAMRYIQTAQMGLDKNNVLNDYCQLLLQKCQRDSILYPLLDLAAPSLDLNERIMLLPFIFNAVKTAYPCDETPDFSAQQWHDLPLIQQNIIDAVTSSTLSTKQKTALLKKIEHQGTLLDAVFKFSLGDGEHVVYDKVRATMSQLLSGAVDATTPPAGPSSACKLLTAHRSDHATIDVSDLNLSDPTKLQQARLR